MQGTAIFHIIPYHFVDNVNFTMVVYQAGIAFINSGVDDELRPTDVQHVFTAHAHKLVQDSHSPDFFREILFLQQKFITLSFA